MHLPSVDVILLIMLGVIWATAALALFLGASEDKSTNPLKEFFSAPKTVGELIIMLFVWINPIIWMIGTLYWLGTSFWNVLKLELNHEGLKKAPLPVGSIIFASVVILVLLVHFAHLKI